MNKIKITLYSWYIWDNKGVFTTRDLDTGTIDCIIRWGSYSTTAEMYKNHRQQGSAVAWIK